MNTHLASAGFSFPRERPLWVESGHSPDGNRCESLRIEPGCPIRLGGSKIFSVSANDLKLDVLLDR